MLVSVFPRTCKMDHTLFSLRLFVESSSVQITEVLHLRSAYYSNSITMGGNSSRASVRQARSSANYANGGDGANGASQLPQMTEPLYTGPIHTLCRVGDDSLLSGGVDKETLLYSWTAHVCSARFQGPTKDVTKVDYNPKSNFVHAASRDRFIYGWKWPPEDPEPESEPDSDKKADSKSKSSALRSEKSSEKGTSPLVFTEAPQKLEGHSLGVTALASSPDYPQLLCSGSRDNSVCLWDTDTGKSVSIVRAPRNLVTELEWIGGEMAALQSSEDKMLRVWDLRACSMSQQFRARNYMQTCCAVSADHQQFLAGSSGTGSQGAMLTLWDRRNEKRPLKEFIGHTESVHGCMFLTHQGQQLVASSGADSAVKLWDASTADCLHSEYVSGAGPLTAIVSPAQGLIGCSSFKAGVMIWTVANDSSDKLSLTIRAKY